MRLKVGLTAVALTIAGVSQVQAQMRFEGMDRNRDGVIARSEWNGTDQAFRNQDWDGDGVLSGDEVRPGARRQDTWNQDWNRDGIVNQQDTLVTQRFRRYDSNGDGRVTASEWPGNRTLFSRLDTNRDGYLTLAEYTNNGGYRADSQGGPSNVFTNIDRNRDGWITRSEWNMDSASFNRLDTNRDNRISNFEFQNGSAAVAEPSEQRFLSIDRNRDGWVTRAEAGMTNGEFNRLDTNSDNRLSRFEFDTTTETEESDWNSAFRNSPFQEIDRSGDGWVTRGEWSWNNDTFDRVDTNNDGRISRFEFETAAGQGVTSQPSRTRSYQSGFDRGLAEGRTAGRDDRSNGRGWDLEGQTELERADSGYYSEIGSFGEYQTGYRDGFRQAYREGYGR